MKNICRILLNSKAGYCVCKLTLYIKYNRHLN